MRCFANSRPVTLPLPNRFQRDGGLELLLHIAEANCGAECNVNVPDKAKQTRPVTINRKQTQVSVCYHQRRKIRLRPGNNFSWVFDC